MIDTWMSQCTGGISKFQEDLQYGSSRKRTWTRSDFRDGIWSYWDGKIPAMAVGDEQIKLEIIRNEENEELRSQENVRQFLCEDGEATQEEFQM